MIAITDLVRQYENLAPEIQAAIEGVCRSGYFIKGPALKAFEQAFADYLDVPYAIGVNSGTDALFLALKAAGIGPGDEVITTAMSFLATAEAISLTGAEAVFVDIDPATDCLRADLLSQALSVKTKAIIPVHLHGYPCDMGAILDFAQAHNLRVIEDCAQSTGATWRGRQTGSIGDMGCFSFFPTKNLGCFGDGGLVCTRDEELYTQLLLLREHGCERKNYQDILGVNSRLDTLQAAILLVKLPYLDRWNAQRRELAAHYDELLEKVALRRPPLNAGPETQSVFHHYALRIPSHRDALIHALKEDGIECLAYYPQALHRQKLYQGRYPEGSLAEAEACARQTMALPLFPELRFEEQRLIVDKLTEHLDSGLLQ